MSLLDPCLIRFRGPSGEVSDWGPSRGTRVPDRRFVSGPVLAWSGGSTMAGRVDQGAREPEVGGYGGVEVG